VPYISLTPQTKSRYEPYRGNNRSVVNAAFHAGQRLAWLGSAARREHQQYSVMFVWEPSVRRQPRVRHPLAVARSVFAAGNHALWNTGRHRKAENSGWRCALCTRSVAAFTAMKRFVNTVSVVRQAGVAKDCPWSYRTTPLSSRSSSGLGDGAGCMSRLCAAAGTSARLLSKLRSGRWELGGTYHYWGTTGSLVLPVSLDLE